MKSNKGFTLVEVLIVTVLGIFLLGAIVYTAFNINRSMVLAQRRVEVQEAARNMIGRIVKDFRGGSSLVTSVTIDSTLYTTSTNTAVLRLPSVDANGNVLSVDDHIVFTVINGELRRITQADATSARNSGDILIGRGVTSIVFSSGSVGLSSVSDLTTVTSLNISLTVARTGANLTLSETYLGSVNFRN